MPGALRILRAGGEPLATVRDTQPGRQQGVRQVLRPASRSRLATSRSESWRFRSTVAPEQEVMTYVEVALRGASGLTGPLCGFVPCSPGERSPGDVWRPAEVGLALGNRRRWAAGPNPGLWRLPGLRSLPRWECGRALFPRCPGGGRDLGSVWLVEGAGYGRSHPVTLSDGGLLRSHETAADGS